MRARALIRAGFGVHVALAVRCVGVSLQAQITANFFHLFKTNKYEIVLLLGTELKEELLHTRMECEGCCAHLVVLVTRDRPGRPVANWQACPQRGIAGAFPLSFHLLALLLSSFVLARIVFACAGTLA